MSARIITDVEFCEKSDFRVRQIGKDRVAAKQASRTAMRQRKQMLLTAASPAPTSIRSAGIVAHLFRLVRRLLEALRRHRQPSSRIYPPRPLTVVSPTTPKSTSASGYIPSAEDRSFPFYAESVVRKLISLHFPRMSRARALLYRQDGSLRMQEVDGVVLGHGTCSLIEIKSGLVPFLAAFRSRNLSKLRWAVRIASYLGRTTGVFVEITAGAPADPDAEAALIAAVDQALVASDGAVVTLSLSRQDIERLGESHWIPLQEYVRRGQEYRRRHTAALVTTAQEAA
jgi:hypothetical protein